MKTYESKPRGLPVHEFVGGVYHFSPDDTPEHRGFNDRLALVMSMQVLNKRFDLGEILNVAPNIDVGLFQNVPCDYGLRIGNQLERCINELKADYQSRRAVVVFADKNDTVPPCILAIQFMERDRSLITIAYMRSWDLTLGLAYDVHMFKTLAAKICSEINVVRGDIYVFAGNSHIYKGERK
jgi:hypothetical protein